MALVSVTVNGRSYKLECEKGQEEHARKMAAEVERRVQAVQQAGFNGENRPVVIASILMADELAERSHQHHEEIALEEVSEEEAQEIDLFSQQLEQLAQTAEMLADSMESAYGEDSEAS